MKPVLWIFPLSALVLSLSNCASNKNPGGPQAVTGPFDRNGNYVEEWADNPSKWRKSGGAPSPHEQRSDELPEIAKNEQPPQNSVPLVTSQPTKPAPVIASTEVKKTPPKTTTTVSKPVVVKAKPKPKPVVKAKPKSIRYVVKKGDSLSAIASRTGSSVTAIKSANGISGTLIRPGQSLTIPKK
jgi:LysM repeat protein